MKTNINFKQTLNSLVMKLSSREKSKMIDLLFFKEVIFFLCMIRLDRKVFTLSLSLFIFEKNKDNTIFFLLLTNENNKVIAFVIEQKTHRKISINT